MTIAIVPLETRIWGQSHDLPRCEPPIVRDWSTVGYSCMYAALGCVDDHQACVTTMSDEEEQ